MCITVCRLRYLAIATICVYFYVVFNYRGLCCQMLLVFTADLFAFIIVSHVSCSSEVGLLWIHRRSISKLRSITCHMGSYIYSATCHSTQVSMLHLNFSWYLIFIKLSAVVLVRLSLLLLSVLSYLWCLICCTYGSAWHCKSTTYQLRSEKLLMLVSADQSMASQICGARDSDCSAITNIRNVSIEPTRYLVMQQ